MNYLKNNEEVMEEVRSKLFLDQFTCDWEEVGLSAYEIVAYMSANNKLPQGMFLWELVEHYEPKDLVKDYY